MSVDRCKRSKDFADTLESFLCQSYIKSTIPWIALYEWMALNSLICADVPLRNCSLTHSYIKWGAFVLGGGISPGGTCPGAFVREGRLSYLPFEHHPAPLCRFCDSGTVYKCRDLLTYLFPLKPLSIDQEFVTSAKKFANFNEFSEI